MLGFLVPIGPELLVVSILLVTVSLALRPRVAALPALFAGGLLYWGMYALYWGMYTQGSDALMYARPWPPATGSGPPRTPGRGCGPGAPEATWPALR